MTTPHNKSRARRGLDSRKGALQEALSADIAALEADAFPLAFQVAFLAEASARNVIHALRNSKASFTPCGVWGNAWNLAVYSVSGGCP